MLFTIDKPFKDKEELSEHQKELIQIVEEIYEGLIFDIKKDEVLHLNYEVDRNIEMVKMTTFHDVPVPGDNEHVLEWVVE